MICGKCGKENNRDSNKCPDCDKEFDVRFSYAYLNNAQLLILFFVPLVFILSLIGAYSGSPSLITYAIRVLILLIIGIMPISVLFILFRFTKLAPIALFNDYLERGPNLFLTFAAIVLLGFLGTSSFKPVGKIAKSLPQRFAKVYIGQEKQSPRDIKLTKCTDNLHALSQNKVEPDNAFYTDCGMFNFNELLEKAGINNYKVTYTYVQSNIDFNFDYPIGSKVNLQQIGNVKLENDQGLEITFKVFRKDVYGENRLLKDSQLVREYSVDSGYNAKEYINTVNDKEKINTLIELDNATLLVSSVKGVNEEAYQGIVSSIR